MTRAMRLARPVALSLAVAAVALGCGQQGPLVLPDSARPIERIEQPPATSPEDSEPEDDEQPDGR